MRDQQTWGFVFASRQRKATRWRQRDIVDLANHRRQGAGTQTLFNGPECIRRPPRRDNQQAARINPVSAKPRTIKAAVFRFGLQC